MGGLLVGEDLIRSTLLSAIMADFIIPMDLGLGLETVGEIAGGIVLTAGIASVIITEMILAEEITAIIALPYRESNQVVVKKRTTATLPDLVVTQEQPIQKQAKFKRPSTDLTLAEELVQLAGVHL